jgi:hypothetical protein
MSETTTDITYPTDTDISDANENDFDQAFGHENDFDDEENESGEEDESGYDESSRRTRWSGGCLTGLRGLRSCPGPRLRILACCWVIGGPGPRWVGC